MTEYALPVFLLTVSALALRKRENLYHLLLEGGTEGLKLLTDLIPALVVLMSALSMLRASGAVEALSGFLAPVLGKLGIPPETVLLLLIRPVSGSAALAVGAELIAGYGVNSLIGRTAAVMLGSTETTFYIISIYFGAAGVSKTRYAIAAALIADLTGFVVAALSVKLFFGP